MSDLVNTIARAIKDFNSVPQNSISYEADLARHLLSILPQEVPDGWRLSEEALERAAEAALAAVPQGSISSWTMLSEDVRELWRKAIRAAFASAAPLPENKSGGWLDRDAMYDADQEAEYDKGGLAIAPSPSREAVLEEVIRFVRDAFKFSRDHGLPEDYEANDYRERAVISALATTPPADQSASRIAIKMLEEVERKVTSDELVALFGDEMPIEAFHLLAFDKVADLSLIEVRKRLNQIALKGQP